MSARVEVKDRWCVELDAIAANMRDTDVDELWTLTRTGPKETLRRALRLSGDVYVGYWKDEPVAVFGTASVAVGQVGVPWLLGTDKLSEEPLAFMRWAKRYVAHLKMRHTRLQNVVSADNAPSIRFLRALGFDIKQAHTTMTGARARHFDMEGDLNV